MQKVVLGTVRLLAKAIPRKFRADLRSQLKCFKILAIDLGQWRSIRERTPVDTGSSPIPWYTYPAIEYLKRLDVSDKTIFEWGSGNSSLFWAARAKEVVSVDHDKNWFDSVSKRALSNQKVFLLEKRDEYVGAISSQAKEFDIIVIDGEYRYECSKNAVKYLSDGGLVILDNSDWYPKTARMLREHGLTQVDFSGFGTIVGFTTTTSLFLGDHFASSFRFSKALQPIGGLRQYGDEQCE